MSENSHDIGRVQIVRITDKLFKLLLRVWGTDSSGKPKLASLIKYGQNLLLRENESFDYGAAGRLRGGGTKYF